MKLNCVSFELTQFLLASELYFLKNDGETVTAYAIKLLHNYRKTLPLQIVKSTYGGVLALNLNNFIRGKFFTKE